MRHGVLRHVTIALIAAGLLWGCATTVRFGTPPRTDRLKEMAVGVSTAADVLSALGEPRGRGGARSSALRDLRKILYYEYMEVEGEVPYVPYTSVQRIGFKRLLVFVHEDRYDGHLWFSSGQLGSGQPDQEIRLGALGLPVLTFLVPELGRYLRGRFVVGRLVDPELVETSLRIGESTRADVLSVLGEPHGRGRSLLPVDTTPKTVWAYYYEQDMGESGEIRDLRRLLLWVYLDEDRYEGYMWFSSLPK